MNPTLISYMQRAYHWMLERLRGCDTSGKLILEDFVNNYCFCHANLEKMDSKALYVIADKYPEIVAIYKGLIDRLGLPHKVLYVASASNLLPLREKCVGVYIDFDSANEYALYNDGYATEALTRYFCENTYALGAFFRLNRAARRCGSCTGNSPKRGKKVTISNISDGTFIIYGETSSTKRRSGTSWTKWRKGLIPIISRERWG